MSPLEDTNPKALKELFEGSPFEDNGSARFPARLKQDQDDALARSLPEGRVSAFQSPFGHWKAQTFIAALRDLGAMR